VSHPKQHEPEPARARRWTALIAAVALGLAGSVAACGGDDNTSKAADAGETKDAKLYAGIGSASSEYWASFNDGARAVAKSTSAPFQALASEFEGQKHLEQFGALFSRGCDNCAVTIDPASTAYTKALVNAAIKGGAWIVTLWNKTDDFHPGDKHWVAHTTFDGVDSGYKNTTALIDAIGGKGNIVALRGIPDNPPAIGRRAGMQKALTEHPDVKLLDEQVGNWDANQGQQITETWLAKYGDKIDGVFSANDGMALGAIEALRAKGLNGKVPVTGSDGGKDALAAVKAGDMVSTMFIDPAVQGAVTAALAYAAAVGDVDPEKLTHEQREFNLKQELVTKDNVDAMLERKFDATQYTYEKLKPDFWAFSAGPITYGVN
jgi:ribose transport system substrate-binding protein